MTIKPHVYKYGCDQARRWQELAASRRRAFWRPEGDTEERFADPTLKEPVKVVARRRPKETLTP